jgi:crotonobetainyl-CoA:carnitine CoA-transferase CaiB-like acyl-CoA transferase
MSYPGDPIDAVAGERAARATTGTGILGGLEVVDLSWGIAGPMTGMLLADHGARVTRIEPPAGDPFAELSGTRVWMRGKRRATLDLRDGSDRAALLALARRADIVIESFGPGVAAKLGIDHATLLAANPRLIHCSITGYGETGKHAHRPAYDALVAARTGQQFESRGVVGTTIGRLAHAEILSGTEAPEGCMIGAPRPGPLFSGVPWISLATFYNASVAINAALLAREITGCGQHVHTSMLQGALATTVGTWQRVERADRDGFNSWVFDPRAPKGFFQGSDGRWTHHWVASPRFILDAAELVGLEPDLGLSRPRHVPQRVSPAPEGMTVLHAFHDALRDAVAKLPADDWVRFAAEVGVAVQRVRSPEEALRDPEFERDGSVVDVDGPPPPRLQARTRLMCGPRPHASMRRRLSRPGNVRRSARRSKVLSCSTSASRSRGRSARSCSPTSARRSSPSTAWSSTASFSRRASGCRATGGSGASQSTSSIPMASPSYTSSYAAPTCYSTTCATTPPSGSVSTTSRSST